MQKPGGIGQAAGACRPPAAAAGVFLKAASRGSVSIQFLLVLIIIMPFILSFFQLCVTLAMGSATQYLTYATARSLSLGGKNESDQETYAKAQYDKLIRQDKLFGKSIGSSKWFAITGLKLKNKAAGGRSSGIDRELFYGAAVEFQSHVAGLHLRFLTKDPPPPRGLTANIGSYLGREPSTDECESFIENRANEICRLYKTSCDLNLYDKVADNGC